MERDKMKYFETTVTVMVIIGLILLNIFPNNNIITWIALIVSLLFVAFMYVYHKSV